MILNLAVSVEDNVTGRETIALVAFCANAAIEAMQIRTAAGKMGR